MFCSNCGVEILREGAKFCPNCGFELSKIQKSESAAGPPIIDSQPKSQPGPPTPPQPDSGLKLLPERGVPLFHSTKLKEKVGWGWGWFLLLGYVGSQITQKYQGCYAEYTGILLLVGGVVAMPVYFSLRKRSKLLGVTRLSGRSFVAGILASIGAFAVVALTAGLLDRATLTPTVGMEVTHEIESMSASIQAQFQKFAKTEQNLWAEYIQEPTTAADIQRNIAIIEKTVPLYKSNFAAVATFFRKWQATLDSVCRTCPRLGARLSKYAKPYENMAMKAEQLGEAYRNALVSLLNYNQALMRADGSASTYQKAAESALAQAESARREFALLCQQASGPKRAK